MYKVGDEVLIKGAITNIEDYGAVVFVSGMGKAFFNKKELIPADETYEQGLEDAMELLRKVKDLSVDEREKVLGYRTLEAIIADLTMEYVVDQLEAYEKEKEIKVGDVVKVDALPCVVTAVYKDSVDALFKDGTCENLYKTHIEKTNKHIDIESLLKQIGE